MTEDLTHDELDALAAERGVDNYPKSGTKADKIAALETTSVPDVNTWRHADGRIRRTRPGTVADRRYAAFDAWTKQ